MFQAYQKLNEFHQEHADEEKLSIGKKLAILDGMLEHAKRVRADFFKDPFSGIQQKIEMTKLLHSVRRTAR